MSLNLSSGETHVIVYSRKKHKERLLERGSCYENIVYASSECLNPYDLHVSHSPLVFVSAARFEVLLLCYYKGYNMTHDIVTGTSGRTHHINELARVHDEEFLHCCFRLARKLQTFGISDIEVLLLQAIVIFFTGI